MRINFEIPDNLHRALKLAAAWKGMTLKDTIIAYLIVGLKDDADDLPALADGGVQP